MRILYLFLWKGEEQISGNSNMIVFRCHFLAPRLRALKAGFTGDYTRRWRDACEHSQPMVGSRKRGESEASTHAF